MGDTDMRPGVLVTGASGLLGRALMTKLSERARDDGEVCWRILGLAFTRAATTSLLPLDLTDRLALLNVLDDFKPDVVIHAAAERRPDVVEKNTESTKKLNVDVTKELAEECAKRGCHLLYISTDYVFDGTRPPYAHDATPNPLNKYGASKLQGENVVRDQDAGHSILRVPVLYGPVEGLAESAVTVLFGTLLDSAGKGVTAVDDYQRRYPTHVRDVASICWQMAQRWVEEKRGGRKSNVTGVFHWSGTEEMSKFEMVATMARIFSLKMDHIRANKTAPAAGSTPRPHDCKLDCTRLEEIFPGMERTKFEEGIEECLRPFLLSHDMMPKDKAKTCQT